MCRSTPERPGQRRAGGVVVPERVDRPADRTRGELGPRPGQRMRLGERPGRAYRLGAPPDPLAPPRPPRRRENRSHPPRSSPSAPAARALQREARGSARPFPHSKPMLRVALDRDISLGVELRLNDDTVDVWRTCRDEVREVILHEDGAIRPARSPSGSARTSWTPRCCCSPSSASCRRETLGCSRLSMRSGSGQVDRPAHAGPGRRIRH